MGMAVNTDLDLSIIVPAFNESGRLPGTVSQLKRFMERAPVQVELILVDDGSTDGTDTIIRRACQDDRRVRSVLRTENRGKGRSVREGFETAQGACCVFLDADLAYGLDPILEIHGSIQDGADMAIGARDLSEQDSRQRYGPVRRMATAGFGMLVQTLLRVGIPDTQCGLKGFRRDVALELARCMTVEGFAFDIEILVLARLWSLRIDRIPVEMSESQGSTIRLLKDSLQMGREVATVRFNVMRGKYPHRPRHL